MASLSGGEKNVLSLAHALLLQPQFLVLDEPANHLDFLGVAWLEDFLARFKGAVLIVSHNRHLLDRVVGGILTLEDGAVKHYQGGYSTYRATMLRELIAQQADYVANQKRLAQLKELVKRLEQVARNRPDPKAGKRLRARRSLLEREKAQAVEKPVLDQSQVRAEFTTERTRSNIALQIRGYEKSFGDLKLFESVDLDIASGERVALVGPNGSGKTSLLHDLVETGGWDNEVIRIGPSMRLGYAAQQQEVTSTSRPPGESPWAGWSGALRRPRTKSSRWSVESRTHSAATTTGRAGARRGKSRGPRRCLTGFTKSGWRKVSRRRG